MTTWTDVRRLSLAVLIVLVAYVPYFQRLMNESRTNPYAAHVALVPALALVLVWTRRAELPSLRFHRNAVPLAVVGMAAAVLVVGYRTETLSIQTVSLVAAGAGLASWAYGAIGVRRLAFVLTFLLLMIPPPREVVAAISPAVQHLTAAVCGVILRVIGVPVIHDGILLGLVDVTLEVAEECSGLRFLGILFVITVAFARLVLPTRRAQILLVALAIPVALIANVVRVVVTSAGTYLEGPHVATGPSHYYIGKICWFAALIVVVALARLLRRQSIRLVMRGHPTSILERAS
jgi:exosortase